MSILGLCKELLFFGGGPIKDAHLKRKTLHFGRPQANQYEAHYSNCILIISSL
jgi:hypothetical protein